MGAGSAYSDLHKYLRIIGFFVSIVLCSEKVCSQCAFKDHLMDACYRIPVELKVNIDQRESSFPNSALRFGNKSSITFNNDPLSQKSGSFSLIVRLRPLKGTGREVILSRPYTLDKSYGGLFLYLQDGVAKFSCKVSGARDASVILLSDLKALSKGKWAEIVVAADADSHYISLYVNRKLKATAKWNGKIFSELENAPLAVGTHLRNDHPVSADNFSGDLDDIKIFSKPMNGWAVKKGGISEKNLLFHLDFNKRSTDSLYYTDHGSKKYILISSTLKTVEGYQKSNNSLPITLSGAEIVWSTGDTGKRITITPEKSAYYLVSLLGKGIKCRDSIYVKVHPELARMVGDTVVNRKSLTSYLAQSSEKNSLFHWEVDGGKLFFESSSNKADIIWGKKKGKGTVRVQEITSLGCKGPEKLLNITITK